MKAGAKGAGTAAGSAKPARGRMRSALIWARKAHLYAGVLFAPAILFFAFTGLLQVYDLHKARGGYRPAPLIVRLGALHKDQTFALPHKAERDGAERDGAERDGADEGHGAKAGKHKAARRDGPTPAQARPMGYAQALLKGFAAALAVSLIATTLLGLYMAYSIARNRVLIGLLLGAGLVVPMLLAAMTGG